MKDSEGGTITVVYESRQVDIPAWVVDLPSFRRWADQDDFPNTGHALYLKGGVWVDLSKEQLFTHVEMKGEFTGVLRGIGKIDKFGYYFSGLFLANLAADLACQPDGTFVSFKALETGQARFIGDREGDFVELEGTPDMVLEIVSDSSVRKDTILLRQAYWEASVREYWLVDARQTPLRFDILRWTAKRYVATRAQRGWLKSAVFGQSFRLTQGTDKLGYPDFTLEVR